MCYFFAACILPRRLCVLQILAFLAFGDVLDAVQACADGGTSPSRLLYIIEAALDAFTKAGWHSFHKKKFHWLLHFSDHLRKLGFLPNCFSTERKNKNLKQVAHLVKNTNTYHRSVLEEILCCELAELKKPGLFDLGLALLSAHAISKSSRQKLQQTLQVEILQSDLCSSRARLQSNAICTWRDVALLKSSNQLCACEIWLFLSLNTRLLALVSQWTVESYVPEKSCCICSPVDSPMLVDLADVICSVTYSRTRDGKAILLIPFSQRF